MNWVVEMMDGWLPVESLGTSYVIVKGKVVIIVAVMFHLPHPLVTAVLTHKYTFHSLCVELNTLCTSSG